MWHGGYARALGQSAPQSPLFSATLSHHVGENCLVNDSVKER